MPPFLVDIRICYEIDGWRHCVVVERRDAKQVRDRVVQAGGVIYWTQVLEE